MTGVNADCAPHEEVDWSRKNLIIDGLPSSKSAGGSVSRHHNKRGSTMRLIDCLAQDQAQMKLRKKRTLWQRFKQKIWGRKC